MHSRASEAETACGGILFAPLCERVSPRSAMTSTEANESHEPSGGLLAGGHPLPSLRPHKHRNCISRSAVMDEHPRPVSATSADLPDGRNQRETAGKQLGWMHL